MRFLRSIFSRSVGAKPHLPPASRIAEDPDSDTAPAATADDFRRRAEAKAAGRDWIGAIADFSRAIALDPSDPRPFAGRANAKWARAADDGHLFLAAHTAIFLERDGALVSVIADLTKALDRDPGHPALHFRRGTARNVRGDVDGAVADHTAAIAGDPAAADAYLARGLALVRLGRDAEAEADLAAAVRLRPAPGAILPEAVATAKAHPHPPPGDGEVRMYL